MYRKMLIMQIRRLTSSHVADVFMPKSKVFIFFSQQQSQLLLLLIVYMLRNCSYCCSNKSTKGTLNKCAYSRYPRDMARGKSVKIKKKSCTKFQSRKIAFKKLESSTQETKSERKIFLM